MAERAQLMNESAAGFEEVITPEALDFLTRLHRCFNGRRLELLAQRDRRQQAIFAGESPDFLPETREVREARWRVGPIPEDVQKRHVEITGPTDAKMVINALNSGADVFMADFEDANAPTWKNMVQGQLNLQAAVRKTLSFSNPDGKTYRLNSNIAVLMVRPRGWHLEECHILIDGQPMSASLFDFGLYFFHNTRELIERGTGPYFYLPKLESHLEARLWNDVFRCAEQALGVAIGTIKATVLIETILAAFEMDEILYELREHMLGLNAGRWDYIFSIIKKFRNGGAGTLLPDRAQVTMTAPFMRAYANLLVQTCHKRGAYAMGGMAAFIPSRRDAKINEIALAKVREDKLREVNDGFDGTWVAHPDLVPIAREVFQRELDDRCNQLEKLREDVHVAAADLLSFDIPGGKITESGLRSNISIAVQYLESWLRGLGAVAINNLMEDTATAEISRAQVWQWIHQNATLADGRPITIELFRELLQDEMQRLQEQTGAAGYAAGRFEQAAEVFDHLATDERFADFLTVAAQQQLEQAPAVAAHV